MLKWWRENPEAKEKLSKFMAKLCTEKKDMWNYITDKIIQRAGYDEAIKDIKEVRDPHRAHVLGTPSRDVEVQHSMQHRKQQRAFRDVVGRAPPVDCRGVQVPRRCV